jgi:cobalt-zinc-cadmium efflux system outer membrane protein
VVRQNPILSATFIPGSLVPGIDERSWGLGVSQTFDVSGSWGPRRESARADRDRTSWDREEGLRALDEAVAIAMADAARAQRRVERTGRIVALQTTAAEAAHKQLEIGQGNQLDVDAADLDLAVVRGDARAAASTLGVARAELARLLGRIDATSLSVEDSDDRGGVEDRASASHVEQSPRVQSARAEVRAAELGLATERRMVWPEITLRLGYDDVRHNVPLGAFRGPVPGRTGLAAAWDDRDVSLGFELPVPLFNQRQAERARATSRILSAEAVARIAEADVRRDVEVAYLRLDGAARVFGELAKTPEIVNRELELLDKAVRSGALDVIARAVAIRRLQEAGARYEDATRELRVARARWRRVTMGAGGSR